MGPSFTIFLVLLPFLLCTTTAISTTLSPSFASDQIKFWSENVQNKMPTPILKKLSPLTQKDSDYYANMISNNLKFSADSSFCSLAKLACGSALETNRYATAKTSGINAVKIYSAKTSGINGIKIYSAKTSGIDTIRIYGGTSLRRVEKNEDPFSFFRLSILKNGNLVHLPNLEESLPDRAFLPPQIASRISLNIKEITKLFPGSATNGVIKETIETTLSYCDAPTIKGEVKSCPKSLEEMINFSKSALGGKKLISLTSKITQGSHTKLMVQNIKKFTADRIVACHEVFLPFAAYFCHSLSSTSLYSVDLVEPKNGALQNTLLAVCHMDTSLWPENHVAFKILKLKPGQGEACHWFGLAWILDRE